MTKTKLDREIRSSYSPRVRLSLEDSRGLRARPDRLLPLRVEVLDINDNPPAFGRDRYSARANRSAPAGSEIVRVSARDADVGKNAKLTYHLGEAGGRRDPGRFFAVGKEDGVVTTR